jgi:O-antigen/teichoic acid export membrane protein
MATVRDTGHDDGPEGQAPESLPVIEPQPDLLDTAQAGPTAIRGSAIRAIGYGVGVLTSILSASLLIRHLGVIHFGQYVTVLSLVAIVQGITDAGLTGIGVREHAMRRGDERVALLRNLLGLRIVLTSLGVAVAVGFAVLASYGTTLVLGTAAAGAGLLLLATQSTFTIPLTASLRVGLVTALDLGRQLATVAGIVALVALGASVLPFLALTIPVAALLLLATVLVVRRLMPFRPAFERREWRVLLAGVLPYAAAVAIFAVYFRLTVILMSLTASETQTGYYATAFRVLEVLLAVPSLLVGTMLPILARAARDDRDRHRYALERLYEATLVVGAGFGLAVVLGAQFAVELLAGKGSEASVPVLQIQAAALAASFVGATWQYGLLSLSKHRALLWSSAIPLVVSAGLTLLLVPSMEAQGAAIAVTSGELILAALGLALLLHHQPQLRFGLGMATKVAVATGLGAAVLLVPSLSSLVRTILGAAIYLGALAAMRAIPPEIAGAFTGWRRRGGAAGP